MVARMLQSIRSRSKSGNILIMAAVSALVLVGLVGLVIDSGLVYGKRAHLSKAVDAASLAGIAHIGQGETEAERVARHVFDANYPDSDGSVDIRFRTLNDNLTIVVTGQAPLQPLFMRALGFGTFSVGATAAATRKNLVLSLVLDRSGSMQGNGGCEALPDAVDTFVSLFDDARDRLSLATYASTSRRDVVMSQPFKSLVTAAVPRDCTSEYGGYTFMQGGLEIANLETQGATSPSVVKVVVLFTDGLANTFHQQFPCPLPTDYNITGGDDMGTLVRLLEPQGNPGGCTEDSTPPPFNCCLGLSQFLSHETGGLRDATDDQHVRLEARFRALEEAKAIRQGRTYIYTIGLGTNTAMHELLKSIANVPGSNGHNPAEPIGAFEYAPDAEDLQRVFIRIARQILIRLSL